jgi:hypothetical protein
MLGGPVYDDAGRLRLIAKLTKEDYGNLFSARKDRLVYKVDEATGKEVVVDLKELPLIEVGQFYNVQANRKLAHFVRDDLLEPADSQIKLSIYRNDIEIRSSALTPPPGWSTAARAGDLAVERYYRYQEARSLGFPKELVDADRLLSADALPKGRAERLSRTLQARDRLKWTLRNALCDWLSFSTLTYPASL